jgi:hypothetical protein
MEMNTVDNVEELTQCVKNLKLPVAVVGAAARTVAICAAKQAGTLDETEMKGPTTVNVATVGSMYQKTAKLIRTITVISSAFSIVFLVPLMRNNHVVVKVAADGTVLVTAQG